MSLIDAKHLTQMGEVKLRNWGKYLPELNETTANIWKFKVDNYIKGANAHAAVLIMKEQVAEDRKTPLSATTEMADAKEWKAEKPDDYKRVMGHIYEQMTERLSRGDTHRIMSAPYPEAEKVYELLIGKYNLNTRTSRFRKVKEFFNLEMELGDPDAYTNFVNKIDTSADRINGMQGKLLQITDQLKTVGVILGGQVRRANAFNAKLRVMQAMHSKLASLNGPAVKLKLAKHCIGKSKRRIGMCKCCICMIDWIITTNRCYISN
jgi:hypothetical protein